MNVDVDIEGITKDAAAEADRVAADEAARTAHEETIEKAAEEAGNESRETTDGIPAAGALGVDPVMRASVAG